jgi:hypothetical protein
MNFHHDSLSPHPTHEMGLRNGSPDTSRTAQVDSLAFTQCLQGRIAAQPLVNELPEFGQGGDFDSPRKARIAGKEDALLGFMPQSLDANYLETFWRFLPMDADRGRVSQRISEMEAESRLLDELIDAGHCPPYQGEIMQLFSKGFDGLYTLTDKRNGDRISIGDVQNGHRICGGTAPHNPSSSGFIHTANRELYAHAVQAEWVLVFQIGDRVTMTDAACENNPELITDELNGEVIEVLQNSKLYIQTDDGMTSTYAPEMWERS